MSDFVQQRSSIRPKQEQNVNSWTFFRKAKEISILGLFVGFYWDVWKVPRESAMEPVPERELEAEV